MRRYRAIPARPHRREGIVTVLALIMLGIFSGLAVAMLGGTTSSMRQAANHANVETSRYQAESGLTIMLHHISAVEIPSRCTDDAAFDHLYTGLSQRLDCTPTLGGQSISRQDQRITVPSISLGADGANRFESTIDHVQNETIRLTVTGFCVGVSRTATIDLKLTKIASSIFDYGIASQGPLSFTGNAAILGTDDIHEADVLAATYVTDEAIRMVGNCEVAGTIFISNPSGYMSYSGNIRVGGQRPPGEAFEEQVVRGCGDVLFCPPETDQYRSLATTDITSSTPTGGNRTFENARIVAGANPSFSGNTTIKGILFIETPNTVTFSGNTTITGMIIAAEPPDEPQPCSLKFTGNTTVRAVDQLPMDAKFDQVRELTGVFLLAVGFDTQFSGNFGTVNGCMAASGFKFTGNAGGTVYGNLISFGPNPVTMTGNARLIIDRMEGDDNPPGFAYPRRFAPDMDSYKEFKQ